jgi:hypothetical protein
MNANEILERIAADLATLVTMPGEERSVKDWTKRLEAIQETLAADLIKAQRWAGE